MQAGGAEVGALRLCMVLMGNVDLVKFGGSLIVCNREYLYLVAVELKVVTNFICKMVGLRRYGVGPGCCGARIWR